jgi:predicted site-specific integrase-resolvase
VQEHVHLRHCECHRETRRCAIYARVSTTDQTPAASFVTR